MSSRTFAHLNLTDPHMYTTPFPDIVTKNWKIKTPVFLSPILVYPNHPLSGLASMESSAILEAAAGI